MDEAEEGGSGKNERHMFGQLRESERICERTRSVDEPVAHRDVRVVSAVPSGSELVRLLFEMDL